MSPREVLSVVGILESLADVSIPVKCCWLPGLESRSYNNSPMPGTIVPGRVEEFSDAPNVVQCDEQGNPGGSSDTGLNSDLDSHCTGSY